MKNQKERSRSKSQIKSEIFTESLEHKLEGLPKTKFSGYKTEALNSNILAVFKRNKDVSSLKSGDEGFVVLQETPFYAEAGGQVADRGLLTHKKGQAQVINVTQAAGYYLHEIKIIKGELKVKDKIVAQIDIKRRQAIAKNHTATHLLQAALRQVLGEHVEQSGSFVDEKRLRFDFTHFKQVSQQELYKVENLVNSYIQENRLVKTASMPFKEAQKKNILAFFKEKYTDTVRVVSVGEISSELCGGTHIEASGSIGLFKITSESSIASGIRRIEAVTSNEALELVEKEENILSDIKGLLKADNKTAVSALEELLKENMQLKKELNAYKTNQAKDKVSDLIAQAKKIKGIALITAKSEGNMQTLRTMADIIRQKEKNAVIILACENQGQAQLLIAVSEALIEKGLKANEIIIKINNILESKGGGRPNLAQAGGGKIQKINTAFKEAEKIVSEMLT
jgi:alanyl-tRNA synthetase